MENYQGIEQRNQQVDTATYTKTKAVVKAVFEAIEEHPIASVVVGGIIVVGGLLFYHDVMKHGYSFAMSLKKGLILSQNANVINL